MTENLNVPKREYDSFISKEIRDKGTKEMLRGIDARNEKRKEIKKKERAGYRRGIVSNATLSGLRGQAKLLPSTQHWNEMSSQEHERRIERAKLRAGKRTYRWDGAQSRFVLATVNGREATPEEVKLDMEAS